MVSARAMADDRVGDVVSGADFAQRRRDRLSAEHDPVLFSSAYSCPVPSPDGTMLAWVSDRDGRPRAWVAALPPDGGPVTEPAWPLPLDQDKADPGAPCDVQGLAWSPDGFWLACQLAPGGGERTRVRLVTPDGTHVRDLAPDAPAVTLGSWSPSGRQLGITIFGGGSGDGVACLVDVRDGTSTMLATGPAARVCAVSGDGMRAVVRIGRRGARRLEMVDLRTGRRTELLPGGEATVADARFGISGGQLFVHTDAGAERPALLAVGAQRRRRTVAALSPGCPRRARPRPRGAGPGRRPGRTGVERRRPQRDRPAGPAFGYRRATPPPPGRRHHRRRVHPGRSRAARWQRRARPSPARSTGSPSIPAKRWSRRCYRRRRGTPSTSSSPSCTTSAAKTGCR